MSNATKIVAASGGRFADRAIDRIIAGEMFHCSTLDTSLANDAAMDMVMVVPAPGLDNLYTHMSVYAACGGDADFYFYEGCVYSGGTPKATPNHKRYSDKVWRGTMLDGPTISSTGIELLAQFLPGGSGGNAIGGDGGFDMEWGLKPSTNYLLRIVNRSGQAQRASIGCSHYEAERIPDRS